jgi:general secretion pathway protein G
LERLIGALGVYKLDTGTYPEPLAALRWKPEGLASWQGPYVEKEIPLDSWGREFVYKFPGEHGGQPDLKSLGADGQEGGEGNAADIVSWR